MKTAWLEPIPLNNVQVLPFPVDRLPGNCQRYAEELAEALQVPVDLPAMLMLATAAAATANKLEVEITSGWTEPTNLFVCVALPPAHRKSAVFQAIVAPLHKAELTLRRELEPLIDERQQEYRIMEARLKEAERRASIAQDNEKLSALDEAKALRRQLPNIPCLPRLVSNDATPEKLAELLASHDGRIAHLSPEGGIFDTMAGRYSNGMPNLDVYLMGHAGDCIRVDRLHRPTLMIERPALTIGLTVQPEVICGLMQKPSFHGRGLIARFLFSLPPSRLGFRKIETASVDPQTRARYEAMMETLLRIKIDKDDEGQTKPRRVLLENAARAVLQEFRQDTELAFRPGGDMEHAQDWGGKLPGAIARIAAILHALQNPDAPHESAINEGTMIGAIHIGYYLKSHALAAFDLMGADPGVEDARHVLRWIERQGRREFSLRDAHQSLKGRFKRVRSLSPALEVLIELCYIMPLDLSASYGPGRRPSPRYAVNPCCLPHYSHNTQKIAVV